MSRPILSEDADWVSKYIQESWHSDRVVSRGRLYYPARLPGFIAMVEMHPVGLVTYNIDDRDCEIVTLNSSIEGQGIGSRLLDAVKHVAIAKTCRRVWLITTNDNLHALRFYQRYGLRLIALYPDQLEKSRLLKPEIPLVGQDGIPLRDELELEVRLQN